MGVLRRTSIPYSQAAAGEEPIAACLTRVLMKASPASVRCGPGRYLPVFAFYKPFGKALVRPLKELAPSPDACQ